jgi:transcriptional regulator with XRE-family HTH domain
MSSFGEKVRQMRKDKKWTLKELAERTGLSSPFLSQVERGDAGYSSETIHKISKAFDVDPMLLQAPQIGHENLLEISEILQELSGLPPDKLPAIRQVIAAMKP